MIKCTLIYRQALDVSNKVNQLLHTQYENLKKYKKYTINKGAILRNILWACTRCEK